MPWAVLGRRSRASPPERKTSSPRAARGMRPRMPLLRAAPKRRSHRGDCFCRGGRGEGGRGVSATEEDAFAAGGAGEEAQGSATAEEDDFATGGAGEEAADAAAAEDDTFAVGGGGEEATGCHGRPFLVDVRTKPREIPSVTGTKDPQMVNIKPRVLWRPVIEKPLQLYQLGADLDDRVLPSSGNECLKAIVAQYSAEELLSKRTEVLARIKAKLIKRRAHFHLTLNDAAITHLTFGHEFMKAIASSRWPARRRNGSSTSSNGTSRRGLRA